jgi:hypothetical protein
MELTPSFFPVKIVPEFTGIIGHHHQQQPLQPSLRHLQQHNLQPLLQPNHRAAHALDKCLPLF